MTLSIDLMIGLLSGCILSHILDRWLLVKIVRGIISELGEEEKNLRGKK